MTVIARGNSVFFSFAFLDENGDAADGDSATLTIVYPGHSDYQSETKTLSFDESDSMWKATWDSSVARPGWVKYHAHAISGSNKLVEDGRFKVNGNSANLQHDKLPVSTPSQYDYGAE